MNATPTTAAALRTQTAQELALHGGGACDPMEIEDRLDALAAGAIPLDNQERLASALEDAPLALMEKAAHTITTLRNEIETAIHSGDEVKTERLGRLRVALEHLGLDGFLVPMADAHQGEYLPPSAQRLAWLTGFGGSAGLAIVLRDKAAIFVDGRYTLQVRAQVNTALFEPHHLIEMPPATWLAAAITEGAIIGYHPWLHTKAGIDGFAKALTARGAVLKALDENPIDRIWPDQPASPLSPMRPHPLAYAGEHHDEKIARLAATLETDGFDGAVLSAPDALAWLLNVRGCDVPNNPLSLGFAILSSAAGGTVRLFTDPRKVPPATRQHLGHRVVIEDPAALGPALDGLGMAKARLRLDAATGAVWLFDRLTAAGGTAVPGLDPCARPRAIKNAVELTGARNAHIRDGAALACFFHWLDGAPARGEALDELSVVDRLVGFRACHPFFRGNSFDTISGFGANGAIVHYRASPATNQAIRPGGLLLLDSGAQYLDGTTDVTRTLAIGTPSPEHRDRYTKVLKGHLALGGARFPKGTTGSQLDALARQPLWLAGLDYDHGTGHGVGSFLCVHEGPQRISKTPSTVALEIGMIVSNEPGYYKTGAYGIRIENLVTVTSPPVIAGGERPMLGFKTLTLAPYDRRLIDPALLTPEERGAVDAYHDRVLTEIRPLVPPEVRAWLTAATRPL